LPLNFPLSGFAGWENVGQKLDILTPRWSRAMSNPQVTPDQLAELLAAVKRGELDELLDALDPDKLIAKLKDLDAQTRAVKVLHKAAKARRRWRDRENGGPVHAA
jgi:hypothetical protein